AARSDHATWTRATLLADELRRFVYRLCAAVPDGVHTAFAPDPLAPGTAVCPRCGERVSAPSQDQASLGVTRGGEDVPRRLASPSAFLLDSKRKGSDGWTMKCFERIRASPVMVPLMILPKTCPPLKTSLGSSPARPLGGSPSLSVTTGSQPMPRRRLAARLLLGSVGGAGIPTCGPEPLSPVCQAPCLPGCWWRWRDCSFSPV